MLSAAMERSLQGRALLKVHAFRSYGAVFTRLKVHAFRSYGVKVKTFRS
jgi:hypothetical protein